MFQSLPKLCEQVNSRLNSGNLDFNFNVEAEKNPSQFRPNVLKCTLSPGRICKQILMPFTCLLLLKI